MGGPDAPTFDLTNPRVDGTCVYGPSLVPVDRPGEKLTGVAAGATTCLHELAMLISLTVQTCRRWQELGFGRAAVLYRRTQIMLEAARLAPAHRRRPHATFLNGLWWKLLALQPERIIACLPHLQPSSRSISADELYCPVEFYIEGYSAGSYTGAVLFLALRRLFPACRLAAKLGAVAMPKGVFSLLQTKTLPGRCRVHLVDAEEDLLCDWQPSQFERHVIAHRLDYTVVSGSDKWMGASKHQYLHWLRCQLPLGRHELATLKLRHPEVIPVRDRMAAPLRLASWVRFETVMDRHQWSTAIALLVPSIHLPDDALLALLNQCVPDQGITSMEEAQALLLRNFRVGGAQESECTKWLTAVARDLLRPIPFREVFVILALFLPQLPYAEGAQVAMHLWTSPVVRRQETIAQVTPLAQGLRDMDEYRIAFPTHSRASIFCAQVPTELQYRQLYSMPSDKVHVGCQVGKVYRIIVREHAEAIAMLGVLLEHTPQPKKKSKQGGKKPLKSQQPGTAVPEHGSLP